MLHPTKNEEGDIVDIDTMDGILHLAFIGWKLAFAIIPPPHYCNGYACFLVALALIGVVTFVVGEYATLFGCTLGLPDTITAITFVALGTSLPDTFASMAAAKGEKYADSAVGNVTGSNSVNVFLGLGLPWLIAVAYESNTDYGADVRSYYVPAGALGFSVIVFVACATTCIIFLLIRRCTVKGELGGSPAGRYGSCAFLSCLWFVYIIMCVLQTLPEGGPVLNVTPAPSRPDGFNDFSSLLITKAPWYVCNEATEAHPAGMGCMTNIYQCLPRVTGDTTADAAYFAAWQAAGCLTEVPRPAICDTLV